MAEAPPPTESVPTPAPAPEAPAPVAPREPVLATLGVRTLLEAGAHFGHQTYRWNPKMKPFIFGDRHGVHIIDLDQTLARMREALDFMRELTASGGKVLFVGTKRQAQAPVKTEALHSGQYYVNNRWLGGMLTNFRTVKKSLDRYKDLIELFGDDERLADVSKKERARKNREMERYRKGLEGLLEMSKLPEALFVIDVKREHIAIAEARRLGIAIIAVVDSNCDPEGIDFVIPANDDATRAILLYCAAAAEACLEGSQLHEERVQAQAVEDSASKRSETPQATSGRRVVEIKQPPRRPGGRGGAGNTGGGRGGTRSAGGDDAPAEAKAAEAPKAEPPKSAEPAPAAPEAPAAAPDETPGESS